MRLAVFGLGNPGKKYEKTRHNIGFLVVDNFAQRLKLKFIRKDDYLLACGENLALIKPLLYMNNSGIVVKEFLEKNPGDFLVVVDDIYLPFGKIRVRERGSDGGHRGLASIIYHLGVNNFPRMRIGISNPLERMSYEDYVLSRFNREEEKLLPEVIGRAIEVLSLIQEKGVKETKGLLGV